VEMQDANLSDAAIRDSSFTEAFDVITAVTISSTRGYWAAASRRGEIHIWDTDGLTLRRAWRAHADMIYALAFSPDGRLLASGSWDGAVKLWETESGKFLWSDSHISNVESVAFSADGRLLATGVTI